MIKPCDNIKNLTSPFGEDVFQGQKRWHNGIDIGIPIGTPIYAIADGVVKATNNEVKGYGLYIVIEHTQLKKSSLSAHLSKFNVKVGQLVKQGQIIGYSGNTGLSSGPHLHFEIRDCLYNVFWLKENGKYKYPINPLPLIEREEEMERVYNTLVEIPSWGKPTIEKLVNRKALQGDEKGNLNINETMLRILVINDRMGLYK